MNIFVPNVYQHSIYDIDYLKLKNAGVKCLSFDVDDTLMGLEHFNVPKTAIKLLQDLQKSGFHVILISNSLKRRVGRVGDAIGVPWIARAEKPHTASFEQVLKDNNLKPEEMAHIGNCIMNDVAGGNHAGVITCLVRRIGKLQKFIHAIYKNTREIVQDLETRQVWKKNHVNIEGDQYYQLGETPKYLLPKGD